MPKLTRSVPTYRKHRSSGQAIVTLAGHDHYLGPHGTATSRREYDRLIAEWLAGGRAALGSSVNDLSMVELMARYWRHVQQRYVKNGAPTSEQSCIRSALRFVRSLYRDQPASEFGPLALKAVRSKMVETGLAMSTANGHVHRIRRMIRWAVAEELLPFDQWHGLRAVEGLRKGRGEARETAPVLAVDDAVVDATLSRLPRTVADMVRVQLLTGMRPSEICMLRPMDIDRSEDVWAYSPLSHKTEHHGRRRVVHIGPMAQKVLVAYLDRDPEMHCFRPSDSETQRRAERIPVRAKPVTRDNTLGDARARSPKRTPGTAYSVASYRRAIKRAAEKAGTARWSPNQLRHAAGTAIRKKFGLEAAQCVLGHSKASVTEVYAERDLAKAAQVAKMMG